MHKTAAIDLNRIVRYNGRLWFDNRTCENKKRENRQMNITNRTDLDISRKKPAFPDFLFSKCCDHKVEGYKIKKGMIGIDCCQIFKKNRFSSAIYAEHALKQKMSATIYCFDRIFCRLSLPIKIRKNYRDSLNRSDMGAENRSNVSPFCVRQNECLFTTVSDAARRPLRTSSYSATTGPGLPRHHGRGERGRRAGTD